MEITWLDILVWCALIYLVRNKVLGTANRILGNKRAATTLIIVKLALKTIIGGLLLIPLLPCFIVSYSILWYLTKLLYLLAKFKYGNKINRSFGMDAVWGSESEKSKPFILATLNLEGVPDLEALKRHMANELLNPRLAVNGEMQFRKVTQTFENFLGFYIWRDDENFRIENHFKEVDLVELYPDDGSDGLLEGDGRTEENSFCTDKRLCKYLRDHGMDCMPNGSPQWEVVLLKEGTKTREYTILIRLHHSIGDGTCLIRLLLEHLIDNPRVGVRLLPKMSSTERFLIGLWSVFLIPFALLNLFFKGYSNALHGPELTGKKHFVASKEIPLDLLRKMKKTAKCTMTDILFSCLSKAISCHFLKRNSPSPNFTILFPVGFENPKAPVTMTNTFTMGIAYVPTPPPSLENRGERENKTSETFERLYLVQKELNKVKRDATILSLYWLTASFVEVIPSYVGKFIFSTNGITMGVSNLPGPTDELTIMDDRLTRIRFWIPDREPTGAGVSFMSYKGQVRMQFSVDEALVRDPKDVERILEDFRDELMRFSTQMEL